jgi:mRNA interferase RelE/StbE
MGMKHTPKFTEFSKSDYDRLDGSQKKQVLKSLVKLEESGMNAGQPLHGKLWDCRKLKHKKLGLRVVFRQSVLGVEIIEIVVIGKREDDEVYAVAIERLGRI